MANLISIGTGNFTTAGTWGVVDTTSLLDSEAASTATTTSYVYTAVFTPGAITVDAVALKIASKTSGGTFTVQLYNDTGAAEVTNVVVDIADLPVSGWVVFKFASSHLLLAATNYKIGIKSSTTSTSTWYRNATAGNWSRQLRTTTTGAPAASDTLTVAGELTGQGAGNTFTVTMDNTATTSFGNTTATDAISVNVRSTLIYGTSASTNYYLKYKGRFMVNAGGTFNIGTTGTPMPSTSTAVLEMDSASNVDTGLYVYLGGTFTAQGNALTYDRAKLAANASAAATSLTTDVSTGWLNGDDIVLASTTRTASECEKKALTANAVTTTLTITALTNAHSGTSPTQGELGNLTRNVKIRGISDSLQGYLRFASSATVDCDWVEISRMGSAVAGKQGLVIETTSAGSFNMQRCAIRDFIVTSSDIRIAGGTQANTTFSNNVVYNIAAYLLFVGPTSLGSDNYVDGNLMIRCTSQGVLLNKVGLTSFTNNTVVGATQQGIYFSESGGTLGTWSNNTVHSCTSYGFRIALYVQNSTLTNMISWRNNASGIYVEGGANNCLFDGMTMFGNLTNNIYFNNGVEKCVFKDLALNSDATFSTARGMEIIGTLGVNNKFVSCSFGATTTHSGGDLILGGTYLTYAVFHNCLFASTTEFGSQTSLHNGSFISSQKHDQTAGLHKTWLRYGTISIDTVIYNLASPSQRMTPNSATLKVESSVFRIPVANGQTLTPSVWVRKSAVGDGTAYNGNQPRLMLKANVAAGIASDTVIDTMTVGTGSWEELTGTTSAVTDDAVLEFVVDCDGTTGWINVDDVSVT